MSNYFAEDEVQKRIRRQYRRKFVFRLHFILAVLGMIGVLIDRYERMRYWYTSWGVLLTEVIIISLIFFLPLALHYLWLRYCEQTEAAIDREMKTAYEYRKRKHDEYDYAHLYDTGEFVPENDYPQKRLERR